MFVDVLSFIFIFSLGNCISTFAIIPPPQKNHSRSYLGILRHPPKKKSPPLLLPFSTFLAGKIFGTESGTLPTLLWVVTSDKRLEVGGSSLLGDDGFYPAVFLFWVKITPSDTGFVLFFVFFRLERGSYPRTPVNLSIHIICIGGFICTSNKFE